MQLLINHLGYERFNTKQALLQTTSQTLSGHAELVCNQTNQTIMQLPLVACGTTAQWHTGNIYQVDFSACQDAGDYRIRYANIESTVFSIAEGLLMRRTFSDVLHYFKSQRCSGIYDQADNQALLLNSDLRVDVRGGWYDASGDVSKYLSHLSYANYLNPQQTPMIVWNMLKAYEIAEDQADIADFTRVRLLEEALFGADFLVRMQSDDSFFYMTVFDKWSKSPAQRDICAYATQDGIKTDDYQAGFRQGGGVAIAALAAAARITTLPSCSRIPHCDAPQSELYLQAAERGYWHLKQHNIAYLNDNAENIIDEYCALLAAVELYRATHQDRYLTEMRDWAQRLAERQMSDENIDHYWSATTDGSRPYYHAAEAGLPAIALMQYLAAEPESKQQQQLQPTLINALNFELTLTAEVNNPFGYPRQYTKAIDGHKQTAFFVAHNNESGYWWQGENARIASLASMAFMAQDHLTDTALKQRLMQYGQQLMNWILGLNPFDMCMLDGHGHNNPDYLPQLGFSNAKGGVCNGITSGFDNEQDIAFNPAGQKDDMLQNWRWGEQWIPHGGWYLLATTLQFKERHHG
ncbi:glycoside hydrolase family 9 protein [Photobacterium kishitanii]|uniref:Chitobiase n=1 Tax=Photobacterium kishitanii TaxID=318456 RepID=A0A2T3KH45_9GAMM|nr:glycoside hydrolase family 9 protein [Photobacterium kishitanii]OBU25242.1 chitobiase [Photobacterium kishitanii]PSU22649.1 chitobiase [Photobacterium kishitanii]PSU98415.1 chitobiase [Photobacterium kishitanii]PSV16189.1 chitobiase [Photobacterium kishitanii]PSW48492.1 chitobiase [Photobacterium kishitanii]